MTTKQLTSVEVGDIVQFLGGTHRIDRIDPPTESGARLGCYGYARSNDGWAIAIYSAVSVDVL